MIKIKKKYNKLYYVKDPSGAELFLKKKLSDSAELNSYCVLRMKKRVIIDGKIFGKMIRYNDKRKTVQKKGFVKIECLEPLPKASSYYISNGILKNRD